MFVGGCKRAAGALAVAAALAACSSGASKPVSLPSLPSSAAAVAATPSPTSTAADLAAVEAVVRRYYSILNHLRDRMDANALAALMTASCHCQEQVRAIREAAAKHEHYIDHARLVSVTPVVDGSSQAQVLVQYDIVAAGLVDSTGHRISGSEPRRGVRRVFHLLRLDGRWLIAQMDAV